MWRWVYEQSLRAVPGTGYSGAATLEASGLLNMLNVVDAATGGVGEVLVSSAVFANTDRRELSTKLLGAEWLVADSIEVAKIESGLRRRRGLGDSTVDGAQRLH